MPRHSIIAEVRVDPGRRQELLDALGPIFAEVEAEHDTLVYAVHADLDDPGTLWIYEQYTDRDAFDLHQASATFEQVVRAIAGFVEPGSVIHQAEVVRAKGDRSA
jgi:quinol monooxygenase YgiN